MSFEIDFQKVATSFNVDIEKATNTSKDLIGEIDRLFPDSKEDFKVNIFWGSIESRLFSSNFMSAIDYAKSKATKFDGVVLSAGVTQDANRFEYPKCYAKFKENSAEAIQEHYIARIKMAVDKEEELKEILSDEYAYVRATKTMWKQNLENGEWSDTGYVIEQYDEKSKESAVNIPLFHKAKKDNGDPNPLYGLPIPKKYEKSMFFWMDNELFIVKGGVGIEHTVKDKDGKDKTVGILPDLGTKCSVWGKKTAVPNQPYKGTINVWKDAYETIKNDSGNDVALSAKELWDIAEKLSDIKYIKKDKKAKTEKETALYVDISDVNDMPNYGFFVTHGEIVRAEVVGDYGKMIVQIKDDNNPKGITLSSYYKPLLDIVEDLVPGNEVVVIGERSSRKTDDKGPDGKFIYKPKNVLCGIFKNPESTNDLGDAIAKLKAAMAENAVKKE